MSQRACEDTAVLVGDVPRVRRASVLRAEEEGSDSSLPQECANRQVEATKV